MKPLPEYGDTGQYHDIRLLGETVSRGWRNCEGRWDIIAQHVPSGVIIDVGSNAGYFTTRMSEDPARLIWSIEGGRERAELQTDIHVENEAANIVLTTATMGLYSWLKVANSVNRIDCILALSVLEYLPPMELLETLRIFSRITPLLIVEFCDPDEAGVGGNHDTLQLIRPVDEYLRLFFADMELIGSTASNVDPTKDRRIYKCRSRLPIYRTDLVGWIGGELGRRHTLATDGRHWVLDGRVELDVAANLWNLMQFGLAYPLPDAIATAAVSECERVMDLYGGEVIDLHPRNLLMTPTGIRAIDVLEKFGCPTFEGFDPDRTLEQWNRHSVEKLATAIRENSLASYSRGFEKWH